MQKLIPLLLIAVTGCTSIYKPEQNSPFSEALKLSELAGTYINEGDPKHYLSDILVPNSNIEKKAVKLVQIHSSPEEVTVLLITNNCVALTKSYIPGQDFAVENGQVTIGSEFSMGSSVHFGPIYENTAIGLDADGHGKYHSKGYGTGLIYLLFPFVFYESGEVKFEKIPTNQTYREC
jgi:hypothetical protein